MIGEQYQVLEDPAIFATKMAVPRGQCTGDEDVAALSSQLHRE